jgi:hypothetical protein
MSKSFSITQWIYVTSPAVPLKLQPLSPAKCADGSFKFALASGENETITQQYHVFRHTLDQIVEAYAEQKHEVVISVEIKAYEYIPEISFPSEFLGSIARVNSSIDIDVINMIER